MRGRPEESIRSKQLDQQLGELCFVVVIYRHGDRAPENTYPKDPHSDPSLWPNGWGQLTKLGELQQFELGKWIRHRYWNFLPSRYNASDIYARSTDVDRTLVSAYCNLAGLYECQNDNEKSEVLTWQPVPVHTVPLTLDSVVAGHKKCLAYDRLFKDVLKSEEVSTTGEYYEEVFGNLSENTGLKICSVKDCASLHSILSIQDLHGFQLPDWTKKYFPQPLREISEFAFKLPCFTTALKRLKCGPLLKDVIQHMEDKQDGKITQKIWMYSGHDTTLANLMQCLNVYDGIIPPYTATVLFELLRIGCEYYVMVSYKTPTTFRVLRMPCCDRVCPFQTFKGIVKPVIPDDWERECAER